jgi:hypothetical protein
MKLFSRKQTSSFLSFLFFLSFLSFFLLFAIGSSILLASSSTREAFEEGERRPLMPNTPDYIFSDPSATTSTTVTESFVRNEEKPYEPIFYPPQNIGDDPVAEHITDVSRYSAGNTSFALNTRFTQKDFDYLMSRGGNGDTVMKSTWCTTTKKNWYD